MSRRKQLLALALAATLMLSVVGLGVGVAPVLAQNEPGPPPATYYGEVSIDGEPAPAGTHVAAVVDGVQQDSMTIEAPGQYGGPGADDGELVVDAESGDEVTFFVNGEPVDTDPSPVEWEAADSEKVDLSGTDIGHPNVAVEIDRDASVTAVEPNGTATVVAEVTNTGDADALEREIAFTVDGERRDVTQVSLSPGESRAVHFTAEFESAGTYRATVASLADSDAVTIAVEDGAAGGGGGGLTPPPDSGGSPVVVTDATLTPPEIAVGGSVSIEVTLENTADDGSFAILPITVDGETVATEAVYVEGGAETTVAFTRTFDRAGEYAIAVDGVEAGTVAVGATGLTVTDASLSETEIRPGETVTVTGTVENPTTGPGATSIELLIDGTVAGSQYVTVESESSTEITFEHRFDGTGEYDVAIADATAGTVVVSSEPSGDDGLSGFGPAAAVIALLAAGAVGRLRAD